MLYRQTGNFCPALTIVPFHNLIVNHDKIAVKCNYLENKSYFPKLYYIVDMKVFFTKFMEPMTFYCLDIALVG